MHSFSTMNGFLSVPVDALGCLLPLITSNWNDSLIRSLCSVYKSFLMIIAEALSLAWTSGASFWLPMKYAKVVFWAISDFRSNWDLNCSEVGYYARQRSPVGDSCTDRISCFLLFFFSSFLFCSPHYLAQYFCVWFCGNWFPTFSCCSLVWYNFGDELALIRGIAHWRSIMLSCGGAPVSSDAAVHHWILSLANESPTSCVLYLGLHASLLISIVPITRMADGTGLLFLPSPGTVASA